MPGMAGNETILKFPCLLFHCIPPLSLPQNKSPCAPEQGETQILGKGHFVFLSVALNKLFSFPPEQILSHVLGE